MVLGQVNRRRGERKAAKAALERASRIFHDLGAHRFGKPRLRAQNRLRGAYQCDMVLTLELTPTEEQVAKLAS